MPKLKTLTLALSAAWMMAGCASTQTGANENMLPVQAVQQVTPGHDDPQALYRLGRYYQGQGRYAQALDAYRQALSIEPRHVDSLTGMGVTYAKLGDHDTALRLLVAAASLDPDSVTTQNNLGYIHWLRNERDLAMQAFRAALKLDPMNARARDNLRLAMKEAANEPGPAATNPASEPVEEGAGAGSSTPAMQQVAPQVYELRSAAPQPVESADKQARPTAVGPAGIEQTRSSGLALNEISPRVYELRVPVREADRRAPQPEPARTMPAEQPRVAAEGAGPAASAAVVGLEVANGNGVKGMARKVAGYLAGHGYRTTSVYDLRPFNKTVTRIEYRTGYASQAIRLGDLLPGKVAYVESEKAGSGVRLVLGHDIKRNMAAWSPWLERAKLADATGSSRL